MGWMFDSIQMLLFLGMATIIHELGHYIGFRLINIKPKITINKWGLILIGENVFFTLKLVQAKLIAWLGLWVGLIAIIFMTDDRYIWITYLLMCVIDINHLISFIGEDENMTVLEMYKKNVGELSLKYDDYKVM